MKRRAFISLLGSAAASWPLPARTQPADRVRLVAVMSGYARDDPEGQARIKALLQGLQELGWTEGRNIRFEIRWLSVGADRIRAYANELTGLAPDVIVCGGTPTSLAMQRESRTIPIVSVLVTDPVGSKLVASLARPGGNVTGFMNYEYTMGAKWLETLKELAPRLARVLVILNPATASSTGFLPALEAGARALDVKTAAVSIEDVAGIESAVDTLSRQPDGGVLVLPDASTSARRKLIIGLVARHRLPAIYPFRLFTADGGLVSYGVNTVDLYRRAASYVDRILKGAKPAELPVQAPTKFELTVNLKTAKAIGLTIPESFLLRADEVIE